MTDPQKTGTAFHPEVANEGLARAEYCTQVRWPARRLSVLKNGDQQCHFIAGGGGSGSSSPGEEAIFSEGGQPCCGRGRI